MSTLGIKDLISSAMGSMRQMMEANNVIGEPIESPDGSIIIPVTKISCGFCAGGFEGEQKEKINSLDNPFGGGSGGGMKVEPFAFLVLSEGNVRLIPVQSSQSSAEKIIDLVPGLIDKLNGIVKDHSKKQKTEEE